MPLTIETGGITPGANAYADASLADPYHLDRGNAAWGSATNGQKSAALINATAYLDGKYRNRFKGVRVQPVVQPLEWPRTGVDIVDGHRGGAFSGYTYYSNYPSNIIPPEVIAATCELALRALGGPLAADIAPGDRIAKEKVDIIETTFAPGDFTTTYQVVDQLVSRFLRSRNDAVRG
jgi:hypothetical protein